jgi:chitinase
MAFTFSLLFPIASRADWPTKVFAPYMYVGQGDNFQLMDGYKACGVNHYTLAFLLAKQDRDGKTFHKQLTWDGSTPLEKNLYLDQIEAIRKTGGDVIASFGGEGGKEIAFVETDPVALQADYQAAIDRYHFTWLDFDIEGKSLDMKLPGNGVRNTVIANLQKKNPGLRISFTLPVDPDGISDQAQAMIADAIAKGAKVYSADLMVMYFGNRFVGKGKSEGQLCIESANRAREQLSKIDPAIQIGLCPCLGHNGAGKEVFGLEDAKTLKTFADQTPWVCSLHYWSINEDARPAGQPQSDEGLGSDKTPREFARLFQPFTSGN